MRRRAAGAFALTALAAAAAGGTLVTLGLSLGAPLKALALVGLLAVLASPALPAHDQPTLGPANGVTLARAVLVAGLAGLLGESIGEAGVMVATVGLLAFGLDGLDGQIARRTGRASPFGARLDMELDALTVVVLCGLAWQLDRAGAWVLWCGAMRYLFVGAAWVWPWMQRPLPHDPRRAIVCGLQITSLLLCLLPWPAPGSHLLAAGGTALLTWSFAVDTLWLVRHRTA